MLLQKGPAVERAKPDEIKKVQEKLLRQNLQYIKAHSTFYQNLFQQHHINIDKVQSLEDLRMIPVTTKDELQQKNRDFICVPPEKIVDYITTSGTLGDPVTFVMTDRDLDRLAYNEYLSFVCTGGSRNDIYQLMTTIDRRFMAGLAYFLGVRKLGAGIVRVGNGIPELQWDTIFRVKPNNLIVVPSFILKIIEYADNNGIDYKSSSIRKAVCIGEPLRNPDFSLNLLGEKIKEKWDIQLFSTYASTEMGTAFTECSEGKGGHHQPELIIVEFLDENDQPSHPDDFGEITITTLGVEGMPLLRFKTGDLCRRHTEPCGCGRNTMRLGPIIGRKKQMIKFKGTTLYPPALYDILNNIEGVKNYVIEVLTSPVGTDELIVHIDADDRNLKFEKIIKDTFRAKLRVTPAISFKPAAEIREMQGEEVNRKPRLFIDRR
jgi:phenylacetate-CoA ligase